MISPAKFNEFFLIHRSGKDLQLTEEFKPKGNLFLCQEPDCLSKFERIWLLDADDTLWEDNVYYEEIIIEFIGYAIDNGAKNSKEEIRQLIDDIEHETIKQHGFGAEGFSLSLQETWRRLETLHNLSIEKPSCLFEQIVPKLSKVPYEIPSSTFDFLNNLVSRETEGLVLFTQGPTEIQLNKIANSNLASMFHAIAVGKNKLATTYSELISRLSFLGKEYIVVGNSLNSEVVPALELNLRAFHFNNPNSWHSVNSSKVPDGRYTSVNCLTDILSLI